MKAIDHVGGDKGDLREMRVFSRVLRREPDGIKYEADPRQHELILHGVGAETLKEVCTPSCKDKSTETRFEEGRGRSKRAWAEMRSWTERRQLRTDHLQPVPTTSSSTARTQATAPRSYAVI